MLNLTISLANELRLIQVKSFKEEKKGEVSQEDLSFEQSIEHKMKECQTINRVNMLYAESKRIHQPFVDNIENTDAAIIKSLLNKPEFAALVDKYRMKLHLNVIKFNS